MQFGDLNILFLCVLPCDFSVVSDDILHCLVLVWLLNGCKNGIKSLDFAVKMVCFIGFRCSYGHEINMCGG